jgi:hypothetical protein
VEDELLSVGFVVAGTRGDAGVSTMKVNWQDVSRSMPESTRRATMILEGRSP